jgi:carbon monoxide dehydrogenase subunit G
MEITTGFELAKPLADAWPVLTDLERVAPCMPGVKVESADEEGLHATMRVKVGPVTASYRTLIALESLDEATKTAVLHATGKETRGAGTVDATVTAVLAGNGDRTSVDLATNLAVTGKVAQFGGGVMTEVADRLLQQFASRLENDLASPLPSPPAAGDASSNGAAEPAPRAPMDADTDPEPADLGSIAGKVLAPRLAIAALIAAATAIAIVLLRRR